MTRQIIIWSLSIVGAIGGLITINYFVVDLAELIRNGTSIERPTLLENSVGPDSASGATATSTEATDTSTEAIATSTEATATPTPIPPLDRQLEEALSVNGKTARNRALRIVAENAVLVRDYWTAITAASASPSSSAQAENLTFVGRCAIEDGQYNFAAEAADKIHSSSDRDRLKIEVLEARKRVAMEDTSQEISGQRINSQVSCWGVESEIEQP